MPLGMGGRLGEVVLLPMETSCTYIASGQKKGSTNGVA